MQGKYRAYLMLNLMFDVISDFVLVRVIFISSPPVDDHLSVTSVAISSLVLSSAMKSLSAQAAGVYTVSLNATTFTFKKKRSTLHFSLVFFFRNKNH